jgi:NADH dehydrogenase FAD-containing subunit/uncharacterized membrane protein YphA (DoxX/SURF4 family)
MVVMAVFGMNPRIDIAFFSSSTLIFPDLILTQSWQWIKYIELFIAVCLLFGIYVRAMAVMLFLSGLLGIYLFGTPMLYYLGCIVGVSAYLFLQGAGLGQCQLPILPPFQNIYHYLECQPAARAQFILRVFAGFNFALTGFICKFLHPNMAIELFTQQHMPTFGLHIETVVFWIAIIEIMAGILLCIGALTRPISFILFCSIAFMNYAVSEPFYSHAIFFGVLLVCYLNGAGQWARPAANDKTASILILGGNLSAIHCAIALERILGKYTNVKVTLVHHENYFQFSPLLPDVISGYVRPSNIINPIRRICENTRIIQGKPLSIDPINRKVFVRLLSKKYCILRYDELVIANDRIVNQSYISGIDQHTLPILNVGDAIYIRENIIECLEQADLTREGKKRQALLTFTVIGAGLRGTSVVSEIRNFIKSAINSYPHISMKDIRIVLIEKNNKILSYFNDQFTTTVHKKLLKMNIEIMTNNDIIMIDNNMILTSKLKIESNTIISALSKYTPYLNEQTEVNEFLQIKNYNNIFVSGMSACVARQIPFQAYYEAYLGKLVAYNVWAQSQRYPLKSLRNKQFHIFIGSLGPEASVLQFGSIITSGHFAWIMTRLISMFTLPGLERNMRILVDWLFNIPFRQDIVSYLPSNMNKINEPLPIENKKHQNQL